MTTQNQKADCIDFFGYQIYITPEGDRGDVMIAGLKCTDSFAEKMREIFIAFQQKSEQLKKVRKLLKEKSKNFDAAQKSWTHRKHCYQRAIAEHQNTTNHLRRQIRAFEQLAKANEESRKELERNKRNGGFSIGAQK